MLAQHPSPMKEEEEVLLQRLRGLTALAREIEAVVLVDYEQSQLNLVKINSDE
jgi:hypothetical protein